MSSVLAYHSTPSSMPSSRLSGRNCNRTTCQPSFSDSHGCKRRSSNTQCSSCPGATHRTKRYSRRFSTASYSWPGSKIRDHSQPTRREICVKLDIPIWSSAQVAERWWKNWKTTASQSGAWPRATPKELAATSNARASICQRTNLSVVMNSYHAILLRQVQPSSPQWSHPWSRISPCLTNLLPRIRSGLPLRICGMSALLSKLGKLHFLY